MTPAKTRYRRMKLTAVRLQAWTRGVLTRRLFLRLRSVAIIVQRTVRGYFCRLRRHELQERQWRLLESTYQAVRVLQNALRQFLAWRKVQAIRQVNSQREKAALRLQRLWYQRNGYFHTFLLMSCYRELEKEESDFAKLIDRMERFQMARKIQRAYRPYRRDRASAAALLIQRWFRGRVGFLRTKVLRRRKYSARLLRHWIRVKIGRRHVMARRIQRRWWLCGSGRLLRHLDFKARELDRELIQTRNRERYAAATRLQSWIRTQALRWIYHLQCRAKAIQRSYRRHKARVLWRAFRLSVVALFAAERVQRMIDSAISHTLLMRMAKLRLVAIRIQAIARGWLMRRAIWRRQQAELYRMKCILRLQRFLGRQTLITKRAIFTFRKDNVYAKMSTIHDLILAVNHDTRNHLSVIDPRLGMTISSLLFRLGLEDYLDMFPKRLRLVADLTNFTFEDYKSAYEQWQSRLERDAVARGIDRVFKKVTVPIDALEAIFNITSIKHYPSSLQQRQRLITIAHIVDVLSSEDLICFIKNEFMSKFGFSITLKAQNLAFAVATELYRSTSNFSSLGNVLTMANISRTIASANTSSKVKSLLLARIPTKFESADEFRRNKERCKISMKALEDGAQRAIQILDSGCLLARVYETSKAVLSFKKRFNHLYNIANIAKLPKAVSKAVLLSGLCIPNQLPREPQHLYSILESTQKVFTGAADYRDLEYTCCISKILLSVFEPMYIATRGFQLLKCRFRFYMYKGLVRRGRLQLFLNSEMVKYINFRKRNFVYSRWDKFRRIEGIALSMQSILVEKLFVRQEIIAQLSAIPRYGWKPFVDDNGSIYWNDGVRAIYDVPLYSLTQWRLAEKIQRVYRKHIQSIVAKKRRQREEDERRIEKERLKAQQFTFSLVKLSIVRSFNQEPDLIHHALALPWNLSFDDRFRARPHVWMLMKSSEASETYQVVLILRVKRIKGKEVTDVRTVEDEIINDVPASQIFKLNIGFGSIIEARYKGSISFYPGRVMSVSRSRSGVELFNIRYDDGEFERKVPLMLIRVPQAEVNRLMELRAMHLCRMQRRELRLLHYDNLKILSPVRHLKVKIVYSQRALKYGWQYRKEKGKIVYYNAQERIKSWKPKEYAPMESASVIKIQSLCRMHICRGRLKQLLNDFTPEIIMHDAIEEGKKWAFVGHRLEGGIT